MTDDDRKMIATLAEKLMGWKVFDGPDPFQRFSVGTILSAGEAPERIVFDAPETGGAARAYTAKKYYGHVWNPPEDWRAAGEVLEAMQGLEKANPNAVVWRRFCEEVSRLIFPRVYRRIYLLADDLLSHLTPRIIAEAAYEAVKDREVTND